MGGEQTEPFILHPLELRAPAEPLVGAEAVNRLLLSWRADRPMPLTLPQAPAQPVADRPRAPHVPDSPS
jgi:hypothetical protein